MSAVVDNVVSFEIPKLPKLKIKEAPPDQRRIAVLPIKAIFDLRLHHGAVRVLAALCSYCNRAGITWVSQTRIAKDLSITQQAVSKQFKQLRECGYLETVRKGFKGERTDTLRVIFGVDIDAETAIAVTSSIEDTRSPQMKKEQDMQAERPDPEGQRRVAQEISKVFKKKETVTKKNQPRRGQPVHKIPSTNNPQVVQQSQPNHNIEVVDNTEEDMRGLPVISRHVTSKLLKEKEDNMLVLNNFEINELKSDGMTTKQIADSIDTLLALYKAEGITPTSKALMAGIRQLKADTR